MRLFLFLLLSFSPVAIFAESCGTNDCVSIGERLIFELPEEEAPLWKLHVQQTREGKGTFEIWFKENTTGTDERICVVSNPLKPGEDASLEKALNLLRKLSPEHRCKVYEKTENGAILGITDDEGVVFVRILITGSSVHFISYSYKGDDLSQVDEAKWLEVLSKAQVVYY